MHSGKSDERFLSSYTEVKKISAAICLDLTLMYYRVHIYLLQPRENLFVLFEKKNLVLTVICYTTVQLYILLIFPTNSEEKILINLSFHTFNKLKPQIL